MLIGIWGQGRNGEFGLDGDMPWGRNLPTDLKWFKYLTSNLPDAVLVVGSKTAKTLPPLKGREMHVISRSGHGWSLDKVKEVAKTRNVICIGGAEIIGALIKDFDVCYITEVDEYFIADTTVVKHDMKQITSYLVEDLDLSGYNVRFSTYGKQPSLHLLQNIDYSVFEKLVVETA